MSNLSSLPDHYQEVDELKRDGNVTLAKALDSRNGNFVMLKKVRLNPADKTLPASVYREVVMLFAPSFKHIIKYVSVAFISVLFRILTDGTKVDRDSHPDH